MMTDPLPVTGKLPIKTLVARQLPTHTHTHTHTHTCSDIRHIIQVYCYPYFSTPMCRADIADHIDMHMTYVNHKFMPQIIDTLLMHSPECIIGRMAQLPYRVVHEI